VGNRLDAKQASEDGWLASQKCLDNRPIEFVVDSAAFVAVYCQDINSRLISDFVLVQMAG